MATFYEWLESQRNSPPSKAIGDFIEYALADARFPRQVKSWSRLESYLRWHRRAQREVIEAERETWTAYAFEICDVQQDQFPLDLWFDLDQWGDSFILKTESDKVENMITSYGGKRSDEIQRRFKDAVNRHNDGKGGFITKTIYRSDGE